jgi:hypothetical protein
VQKTVFNHSLKIQFFVLFTLMQLSIHCITDCTVEKKTSKKEFVCVISLPGPLRCQVHVFSLTASVNRGQRSHRGHGTFLVILLHPCLTLSTHLSIRDTVIPNDASYDRLETTPPPRAPTYCLYCWEQELLRQKTEDRLRKQEEPLGLGCGSTERQQKA